MSFLILHLNRIDPRIFTISLNMKSKCYISYSRDGSKINNDKISAFIIVNVVMTFVSQRETEIITKLIYKFNNIFTITYE